MTYVEDDGFLIYFLPLLTESYGLDEAVKLVSFRNTNFYFTWNARFILSLLTNTSNNSICQETDKDISSKLR